MAFEIIEVVAGGQIFSGWKRVEIRAGIAQAARSFEINATEIVGKFESPFDIWHFPPFTSIEVTTKHDASVEPAHTMCRGFIDDYLPRAGPEEHEIVIAGRGLGALLVDSAPDHPTGQFEDRTVAQIIQELAAPFGVPIIVDGTAASAAGQVVPLFQVRRGETVWENCMRLANDFGFAMAGNADGSVSLTRAGAGQHAGAIAQGDMAGAVKMKEMSARISGADRFSEYRIVYQTAIGTEDENLEGEAVAKDNGVPLKKIRELIGATELDAKRAQSLANWTALRAAGEATQATIVVPGFRDVAGTLWTPGYNIFTMSPFLKLECEMTIAEAVFSQDDQSGTTTTLTLMDPRAFGGQEPSASGSGSVWDFGPPAPWGVF